MGAGAPGVALGSGVALVGGGARLEQGWKRRRGVRAYGEVEDHQDGGGEEDREDLDTPAGRHRSGLEVLRR